MQGIDRLGALGPLGSVLCLIDLGSSFSPSFHVVCARDPQAGNEVYVVDPVTGQAAAEE